MNVLKTVVVLVLVTTVRCHPESSDPPGCHAVYNPVNAITVNACCNQTEKDGDVRQELNEIKELLNNLSEALENGDYCSKPISNPTPTSNPTPILNPIPISTPKDCHDVQESGETVSGVYTITPNNTEPFEVYCDMDTDGGGWTVFQRRQDGTENFYRGWEDYANGFGSLEGEHWLGNDKLSYLTNQKTYVLHVDLGDFDEAARFAKYDSFVVSDSSDDYRLQIGSYSGDAGDAMSDCDNYRFSTYDRDNDIWDNNCAVTFKGAWWYKTCHVGNLNGVYLEGTHSTYADGVDWEPWRGYYYSLKFTEMKLKPVY